MHYFTSVIQKHVDLLARIHLHRNSARASRHYIVCCTTAQHCVEKHTVNPGYNEPCYSLENGSLHPGIRCKGRDFTWTRQGGAHREGFLYPGVRCTGRLLYPGFTVIHYFLSVIQKHVELLARIHLHRSSAGASWLYIVCYTTAQHRIEKNNSLFHFRDTEARWSAGSHPPAQKQCLRQLTLHSVLHNGTTLYWKA